VERMDQMKAEKDHLESKLRDNHEKKKKLQEKTNLDDKEKKELEALTKEFVQLEKEMQEFCKREKLTPWNVDTLSQPKFSKTVINKKEEGPSYDQMTEEQKEQHMKKFVKENEKLIKQYGMLRRFDDSKKFLMEHNLLVHEDTANYLVIWCINLEMEDKHELMTHVAHQCICMQ
jgi:cell division cycle protein 37